MAVKDEFIRTKLSLKLRHLIKRISDQTIYRIYKIHEALVDFLSGYKVDPVGQDPITARAAQRSGISLPRKRPFLPPC